MCIHSIAGGVCACGQAILFPETHWPHCKSNPRNLSGSIKVELAKRFTKAELATIAAHGPVQDERLSRNRKKGKR